MSNISWVCHLMNFMVKGNGASVRRHLFGDLWGLKNYFYRHYDASKLVFIKVLRSLSCQSAENHDWNSASWRFGGRTVNAWRQSVPWCVSSHSFNKILPLFLDPWNFSWRSWGYLVGSRRPWLCHLCSLKTPTSLMRRLNPFLIPKQNSTFTERTSKTPKSLRKTGKEGNRTFPFKEGG